MDWIDVSMPLKNEVVGWPGDVPVEIARRMRIEQGADYNISMVTLSTHAGTHIDAPLHFIQGGIPIDKWPPEATIGPARIIEIMDQESIEPVELEPYDIQAGERIIFKTASSAGDWLDLPFKEHFVYISHEAAEHLASRRPSCVAIDYLSVGNLVPETAALVHRTLLGAGVWIIEGLYLVGVPAGPCELVCMPLKVAGAEGAPARAVLRMT